MKRRVRAAATEQDFLKSRSQTQRLQTAGYATRYARNRLDDLVRSLNYLPDIPGVTGYISDEDKQHLLKAIDILDNLATNIYRVAER